MKVEQYHSSVSGGSVFSRNFRPDLLLVLGCAAELKDESKAQVRALEESYPAADIVVCSTGKFVLGSEIYESGFGVTGIQLSRGQIECFTIDFSEDFEDAARSIGRQIRAGNHQNGALLLCDTEPEAPEQILAGLSAELGTQFPVTGAVASSLDATTDQRAVYFEGERVAAVVMSFNSPEIQLSSNSMCGLDEYGRIHQVTESEGAVIRKIGGRNALDVFRDHIGDDFKDLPLSARHYPFQLISPDGTPGVIRCPIDFNHDEGSIICAGKVPEGPLRLLTFTDHEKLVDAGNAASRFLKSIPPAKLHFFFSCGGRLAVLGPLYELEFDGILANTGDDAAIVGFYADGEIGSLDDVDGSKFHNMTVGVSAICEIDVQMNEVELSN